MSVVFDQLGFVNRLEKRFSRRQAEAMTEAFRSELRLWTGSAAAELFAAPSDMAAVMRFLGHCAGEARSARRNIVRAATERALHRHHIEPAPEFEPDGAHRPGHRETEACVHADRAGVL